MADSLVVVHTAATEGSTLDFETAMALLHHTENIQVGYGAVILSFIGALHWGFGTPSTLADMSITEFEQNSRNSAAFKAHLAISSVSHQ